MTQPILETAYGKLRGISADGVHVFRGVRYGADTGGANRFRPPQPPAPWSGTRDALANGPAAPQLARSENTDPFFAWYSAIEPPSEDCLFLNVFTPGMDDARRPVMFWIHGGGWREYSGGATGFDGSALAREQDVVVVAINHRLGVFGHLMLDGDSHPDAGNVGSLDVVAALEWVRDHACAIGGDPGNVTVFGESGGASKTAALLSMPRARPLFHKAILQSSAGGMRLAKPNEAQRNADGLKAALGLDRLTAEAMRELPMQAVLDATRQVPSSFRGMIDGRTYIEHPFGDHAAAAAVGKPLLIGTTGTEATYYMRGDPGNFALDWSQVVTRLGRFFEIDRSAAARITDAYRAANPEASASLVLFLAASDFIFKRNGYRIAGLQAATGAPVFSYHFEWETPVEDGRMGSVHTLEVPFIFGTTDAARACVGSGQDIAEMSSKMMASWASFARKGDPNTAQLPRWAPYSEADPQVMRLGNKCCLAHDPGGTARSALAGLPYFSYAHNIAAITSD
jgi:para-nitrobenzyl esterase